MSSEADSQESHSDLTVDQSPGSAKVNENDTVSEASSEKERSIEPDNSSDKRSNASEITFKVELSSDILIGAVVYQILKIFDKYTSTMELSFEKIVASPNPHKELTKDVSSTIGRMVEKTKSSYDGKHVKTKPGIKDCSSSSTILTIDVHPKWSVLREHLFRYIIQTKKQSDIATMFSFNKDDARFSSIDAFLNSIAAQWISHDANLLDLSFAEVEYQKYKAFDAYNAMDAMFMLLRLHAFNESGANFFVLENDDDCPEMDTVFWHRVLHVMDVRERPWKFLLLRDSTKSKSGWLSKWPKIQVSEQDVADVMDSAAEECLLSTPSMYLDDTGVLQWKDCIASCDRDVHKASLAMKSVLASSAASIPDGVDLLPQFKEQMNKSVNAIMDDILKRVPAEKCPPLEEIVNVVLFAKRPLNRAELQDISRILSQTRYTSIVDPFFTNDIFNFLELHLPGVFDFTNGEVRLQHPGIRNFLLSKGNAKLKIEQPGAERAMAHICMHLLEETAFADISETMFSRRKVPSQPPISGPCDNLADYAVRYWHVHMREALKSFPAEEEKVFSFFRDESVLLNWGKALHAVSNPVIEDQEIDSSPLAFIANTKLQHTTRTWIENNKDSPHLQAALTRAIKAGNLEVAKVLLEHVDITETAKAEPIILAALSLGNEEFSMFLLTAILESCPEFQWHRSLICRASWLGQDKLVGLMIDKGAPIDVNFLPGVGPLELSVRNNHVAVLRLLFAHGLDPVSRKYDEGDDQTALHIAAVQGYPQMVEMLIKAGADKDMKNTYRPIMSAAVYGNFAAVRALLKAGAEPEYVDSERSWRPLPGAAGYGYTACVEALLEDERTDLESVSPEGTALFEAVDKGHHETCRVLLDKGADPDNEQNFEPVLVHAVVKKDLEMVKLLIGRSNPSAENRTKALGSAIQNSTNVDMVRYLVQNGADYNGQTSTGRMIHEAASSKNVEILDTLVDAGATINAVDEQGQTPLHLAYNNVEMTKRLIEIGCDVNIARTSDGYTPLHFAIDSGEWEVAKTILKEGRPELELKTSSSHWRPNSTPLTIAVWRDHAEMTKLLLEAGADPNTRSGTNSDTIMHLSVDEEVVRTVLDFEPDLRLQNDKGDTALNDLIEWWTVTIPIIKRLLRQGSDINNPNKVGRTPLFKTIWKVDTSIAEALLDRGADINHISKGEGTILHSACRRSNFEVFKFFFEKTGFTDASYPTVGTLISAACLRMDSDNNPTIQILSTLRDSDNWYEANINQICSLFGSALSAACYCNNENVVTWLLSNGAKTSVRDDWDRYPIHFAACRDESLFRLLCNAGADIEVRDKIGKTVLHMAAQSGSYDLVKMILQQNKSLLKVQDHDGWTPLHYALRGMKIYRESGPDPQHKIVQLLISELEDESTCCEPNFRVFGHEEENWSILKLARFHGATAETRKILRKILKKQSGGKWNEKLHETREGMSVNFFCDYCFTVDLCSKCYGRKEEIHQAHEWEKVGQEFLSDDSSYSDEEQDSDNEEPGTTMDEKNSDDSSDNSSTSDES
ncbi:hypothetical protein N0V90_013269 [Kalmusia sp. IMI 367209]|nr:hypothetical protein N0V90_013269 [Kalmusia sp. IMI 367209]